MYTTYDGLSESKEVVEINPLLGKRPSLAQLILFKSIADYYVDPSYLNRNHTQVLQDLNLALAVVVANNRHVKNTIN